MGGDWDSALKFSIHYVRPCPEHSGDGDAYAIWSHDVPGF
jgi:hypothetical protein